MNNAKQDITKLSLVESFTSIIEHIQNTNAKNTITDMISIP